MYLLSWLRIYSVSDTGHDEISILKLNLTSKFKVNHSPNNRDLNQNVLHFSCYDDVIKWKHFPHYWPFMRGIHRSRWIPYTKASDAKLWCFLWSVPERLSKQWWGWWFEAPSCPLWRHCNGFCGSSWNGWVIIYVLNPCRQYQEISHFLFSSELTLYMSICIVLYVCDIYVFYCVFFFFFCVSFVLWLVKPLSCLVMSIKNLNLNLNFVIARAGNQWEDGNKGYGGEWVIKFNGLFRRKTDWSM